jgi:hypothetical protein
MLNINQSIQILLNYPAQESKILLNYPAQESKILLNYPAQERVHIYENDGMVFSSSEINW